MRRLFAILAILVLVFLVGCKSETSPGEIQIEIPKNGAEQPAAAATPAAQTPAETQPAAPANETETAPEAGESIPTKQCDESAVLGFRPGDCTLVDKDAELKITKSERGDVDSLKIEYVEGDMVLGTYDVSGPIKAGSEQTIKLELSKYSPKGVKIIPVVGGEGCINQQLYLPMTSCR